MKQMSKNALKFNGKIASLALWMTAANVNATCVVPIHQPTLPKGAEKFKKFNNPL